MSGDSTISFDEKLLMDYIRDIEADRYSVTYGAVALSSTTSIILIDLNSTAYAHHSTSNCGLDWLDICGTISDLNGELLIGYIRAIDSTGADWEVIARTPFYLSEIGQFQITRDMRHMLCYSGNHYAGGDLDIGADPAFQTDVQNASAREAAVYPAVGDVVMRVTVCGGNFVRLGVTAQYRTH